MILCGLVLTRSLVVRRKANKLKQSLKQFPNRLLSAFEFFLCRQLLSRHAPMSGGTRTRGRLSAAPALATTQKRRLAPYAAPYADLARAAGAVTAPTIAVAITFSTRATMPMFRSRSVSGSDGNSVAVVLWVSTVAATVAMPTTMPAIAPAALSRLPRQQAHQQRREQLSDEAVAHQQQRDDRLAALQGEAGPRPAPPPAPALSPGRLCVASVGGRHAPAR